MEGYAAHSPMKWLVTIVDRGKGERIARVYRENHVFFHMAVLGIGTAQSEIMDYLGLDEQEKDIVLSLVPDMLIHKIIFELNSKLHFYRPGSGIAFSIPLSSISAAACRQTEESTVHIQVDREVLKMEKKEQQQFDLLVSLVDRGQTDLVMEAAKAVGAAGGTIVRARNLNTEEAEKFLKISLQVEREIVLIVVAHEQKQTIMKSICKKILEATQERAMVFSIPIEDVTGLHMLI